MMRRCLHIASRAKMWRGWTPKQKEPADTCELFTKNISANRRADELPKLTATQLDTKTVNKQVEALVDKGQGVLVFWVVGFGIALSLAIWHPDTARDTVSDVDIQPRHLAHLTDLALHGVYVLKAVVCWPTNILSFTWPSTYESKLYDLKCILQSNQQDATHLNIRQLQKELKDLRDMYRFEYYFSSNFAEAVHSVLNLLDLAEVPGKHQEDASFFQTLCYLRVTTEWELVRLQPLRYLNEQSNGATNFAGVFACLGILAVATNSLQDRHDVNHLQKPSAKLLAKSVTRFITSLRAVSPHLAYLVVGWNGYNLGMWTLMHATSPDQPA